MVQRRYAFVHVKQFSGINDALVQALAPAYERVQAVDGYRALDPLSLRPGAWVNLGVTLATYGPAGRRGSRLLKTPYAFKTMSRYVQRELDWGPSADLVLQTQVLCGARPTGKPYVIYTDCTLPLARRLYPGWDAPAALEPLEGEVLRRAELVLVHNDAARQSLVEDYQVELMRTVVIGYAVPQVEVAQTQRHPQRILCVTTDPERHRVRELVEVFSRQLRPDFPRAELQLVGITSGNASLQGDGIYVEGRLSHEAIAQRMAAAGVYAMPSLAGGVSSVLDAMGQGCACVVAAPNPFLGPDVIDNETALVAPTGTRDELVERLRALLAVPDEARQLGQRAQTRVRERATWSAVAGRLVENVEERVFAHAHSAG